MACASLVEYTWIGAVARSGFNPTDEAVRESLMLIFPSVGVRLRPGAGLPWPWTDEARAVGDRAASARGQQAEGGAGHPKKGRSLLREGSDMKFVFIAKHRNIWPVAWLCDALGVSRSGFHAWLNRSPSARSRSDEAVGQQVKASFLASDRTYGARRVWRDLLAEGVACGLHRIERLMRSAGFAGPATPAAFAEGRRRSSGRDRAVEPSGSAVCGRATEPEMDRRLHLHLDGRGLALRGGRDRPVLAPGGRLVDERAGMTAQLVADALKPLGRCRATITMDH